MALPTNLPSPTNPLVGRNRELYQLGELLHQPYARWITLTGAGGTGKTRLALAAAAQIVDEYEDGVFFVALDAVRDPSFVLSALAQTLGIQESSTQSLPYALRHALAGKQMLLVLDNMEQIADAASDIAELLDTSPQLQVLATSRELLRIYGEHNFPVAPFAVPEVSGEATPETLQSNEAVQLFLERTRAVRPDFALTRENAQTLAKICVHLDGLPLAIELVAPHARELSLERILKRIQDHWHLWAQGTRERAERQSTLYAAMDWSYNLLPPQPQQAFPRLAVLTGSWSLDAALAVAGADLDTIGALVDASLVRVAPQDGEPRFRLLETIREYALERLQAQNNRNEYRDAHARYFAAIAQRAESELVGVAQAEWLHRLGQDHDNFRAALGWSLQTQAAQTAYTLVIGLWRFWYVRGYYTEGRAWLEAVFGQGANVSAGLRAQALHSAGVLARSQGDYLHARAWLEASRAEFQKLGDTRGLAIVLNSLGLLALDQINYAEAREQFAASLQLERTLGDQRRIAISLNNLGGIAGYQRDYAQAQVFHAEALKIRRMLNDQAGIANSLLNLGEIALRQNEYTQALALYRDSLQLRRELGDRRGVALCLEGIAAVKAAQIQGTSSVTLYSAAAELRRALNAPHAPVERAEYENNLTTLRASLGDTAYDELWTQGRSLRPEQAIELALQGE